MKIFIICQSRTNQVRTIVKHSKQIAFNIKNYFAWSGNPGGKREKKFSLLPLYRGIVAKIGLAPVEP